MVYQANDADSAINAFTDSFTQICDKHAPVVVRTNIKRNKKGCPWLTKAIRKSIRMKHKLFGIVISSHHEANAVAKYKRYRNLLTSVLRHAKMEILFRFIKLTSKQLKENMGRHQ